MMPKTAAVLALFLLVGQSPAAAADRCDVLGRELAGIARGSEGLAARYRASAERQRAALATAQANASRAGCGRAILAGPDCRIVAATMDRMRRNLASLESMAGRSGGAARAARAAEIRAQMQDLGCARKSEPAGPAIRTAATRVPATTLVPRPDAPRSDRAMNLALFQPGRSYRTLCVRLCDGYYFPISWSVRPSGFAVDDLACQNRCPGTDTQLFVHPTGTESEAAMSVVGQPWSRLPTAFLYRKTRVEGCGCGRPPIAEADGTGATPPPGPLLRELKLPPIIRRPSSDGDGRPGDAVPVDPPDSGADAAGFVERTRVTAGLDLMPAGPRPTAAPSPAPGR